MPLYRNNICRKLKFFRLLWKGRYAEALAILGDKPWPQNGFEQWAAFRQGLFLTVSNTQWDGKSIHGGMAVAISLAICGQRQEAKALISRLATRWNARFFHAQLGKLIAPYASDLALPLLQNKKGHLGYKIVLLERAGDIDGATRLLKEALSNQKPDPQLQLLASNLLDSSPADKLARLNAFLRPYGLAPLALKDARLPPAVGNLAAAVAVPSIDGPLVSVLMTAYNISDRIETALNGLLNQSWRNIEIIVVDDASTDDTGTVVQALASQDARIRYFRLPCNGGTYVAKTAGFQHSRGEFVTCHDSDDWSHPQRIERQVQPLIRDPALIATTSQWVRMEDSGRYYVRLIYPLLQLNPASPMFRRQAVAEQVGLWDAARIGADSEFHSRLRLMFGRDAVRRIAQPLTLGAHRENSLMTASDTGYSAEGVSLVRLAYWEAWARWHISSLRAGTKPQMPPMAEPLRPFQAPESVRVQHEKVVAALHPPLE